MFKGFVGLRLKKLFSLYNKKILLARWHWDNNILLNSNVFKFGHLQIEKKYFI